MTLPHKDNSPEFAMPRAALRSVHEEFETRVAEDPQRVAVVTAAGTTTYGALNARANLIATHLLRVTEPSDKIVAVLADRSVETVATFLGVMKAGRGYLPLDPDYPTSRLQLLIEDSRAPVLATNHALLSRLAGSDYRHLARPPALADAASSDPGLTVSPHDLAYVTYTSGSTGVPKGALLNHRGLARLIAFTREQMQIGPGDRILQFASLSFDASVWEMSCALTSGAALVLGDRDSLAPGPGLYELMSSLGVTVALLSPSVLSVLPSQGLSQLRIVVAGTEKCSEEIARRWGKGRRFFNAYGPTETTVYSTIYELTEAAVGPPPIGRAIPGTDVHILDADLRNVAPGESGELCISGEGVARGYLNRDELTASRFIVCEAADGRRVYRTGDRCRLLPDGNIEYLGRLDRQVKIRGFRVEPGEIEAALEELPGVSSAVVVAGNAASGLLELWAYVQAEAGASPTPEALLAALAARLPNYMVPTALQIVTEWPLTPHNKVDAAALPPPFPPSPATTPPPSPPSDTLEARMAQLCAKVRSGSSTDAATSIFDLGFTSLDVARLLWEIQSAFGVALTYSAVFKAGTVEAIASLVRDAAQPDDPSPSICVQPAPLVARAEISRPLHASGNDARTWPVSLLQRDLYMSEVVTGQPGLAITDYLTVPQPLDRDRLLSTLQRLGERHDLLRTSFDEEGGDVTQRVQDSIDIDVEWVPSGRLSALGDIAFDAGRAPLFRIAAGHDTGKTFELRIDLSHLVADGAAMELVKRDILSLYSGKDLPALPLTYGDYTLWQNQIADENSSGEAGTYWAEELRAAPGRIVWQGATALMQTGPGKTAVQTSTFSREQTRALQDFARTHRITTMMAVAGIYVIALHTATRQRDLIFGSVVSGRRFSELMDIVGPFLSLVPLRVDIRPEEPVQHFFHRVREKVLNGFAYQDFDFNDLYRRMSAAAGGVAGLPFNIGFTMHTVRNRSTLDTYKRMSWPLDLNVEAIEHQGQLELHWIYRENILPRDEITYMTRTMEEIVARLDDAEHGSLGTLIASLPPRPNAGYSEIEAN